jgi:tRNA(Ile)-lysidine synthetase-like protein
MDEIYTFWKNNSNLWFNASVEDDKYIYEKFFNIINNNIINEKDWTSYCIYYDQLYKHFNRHINNKLKEPDNFIINCYINYNKFKENLNDFEFMFQLMPIRHTHQLNHVKFVLNETWQRLSINKDNQFIKKFLIATYERYIKCTKEHSIIDYINNDNKSQIVFNHPEILDKNYNLLHTIQITSINANKDEPFYLNMKDFIINNNLTNKNIIISISGGVDSMVCSYLLKQLTLDFINLKISCVHIDYYNREECEKEEELLIWWCNSILDIPLYIRRIDEINRPKCMEYELRDLYESYTKDVRFNSYITLSEYIILGHNKDDTIENIFTNTASQSHYENLLGMTPISNQSYKNKNICFLRPLINIPKSEIYKFAINNNIPFLQDSTPKWSQRGKIRDIVRPALNEWNPLIFDGLINLSIKMSQMILLLDKLIPSDINNITYDNINEIPIDNIFWMTVLKKNNIYITQKTLINLINRLQYYQLFPHKLKDLQKIPLCKNTMLLIRFVCKKNYNKIHINLSYNSKD